MSNIIMLALLALSPAALAQDSVDVHGFHLTPDDGDLQDPLRTWRAESHDGKSFGLNVLGEYAYRPLVRYTTVDGQTTREIEIQDLAALNLGLFFAPHERLAITATLPAYLAVESNGLSSSGIGVGDLRLSAPVGVLLDQNLGKVDLSVAAVPHLDVPGFYKDQYLKAGGLSGGGVVAATVGQERWQASANLGAQFAPQVVVENLSGNERLLAAASVSYLVVDDLAVRGEWTFNPTLQDNATPWTDSPMELTASVRGHADHRLGWTAGASTALSKGAGAATFRAFLGLDMALGAREAHVCEACETPSIGFDVMDDQGEHINALVILEDYGEIRLDDLPESMEIEDPEHYQFTFVVPSSDLVVLKGNVLYLIEPIYFDFDKATIRFPESTEILSALVTVLDEHSELTLVEVAGHTDERGSNEYNESLSQRRMQSVVDYLSDHGIDEARLKPVGYGERHLLDDDCAKDEECHQLNRRVEFRILERSEEE